MELKAWKFVSRKVVLNHPRLRLVEDQVELPDGTATTYLREAPTELQSVAIIAQNANGEVLLQREYSYPPDEVMWQLPGGTVEAGEDIMIAGNRELSEESGFLARKMILLGSFYTDNRRSDRKQYVLLCSDLVPYKAKEDPEEFIASIWMSVDELKQKIRQREVQNVNLLAAIHLWLAQNDY